MRLWFTVWLLTTMFSAAEAPAGAISIQMISFPAVSPDGKSLVFEWSEDLWTASIDGGEAERIVHHPGRDAYPRFSPDGKRILFSSNRSGSLQIYSIPVTGGHLLQHTYHTEGNKLECLSQDGRHALVRGARERPGSGATQLLEIDLTKDVRERRLFDAVGHSPAWSPDGKSVLFCRGGEQLFRKGYRGARASQIWLYQIEERTFECLVTGETEARSPMWLPDGTGFYFVSAIDGTPNLWRRSIHGEERKLTHFHDDGVITPSLSADGSTLIFTSGFELFRYRPESDPKPTAIPLWTVEKLPDVSTETLTIDGTLSADFTQDLKQLVFSAASDLWIVTERGKPPIRLTETSAAEDEVRFSPAGDWLYFLRDDGMESNYFRTHVVNNALVHEMPVTRGSRSKGRLKLSSDGSKIAWIEGNGDVFTAAADGTDSRLVYKCWDRPTFDWSPDGQWLAIAAEDCNANRDIWLVSADGGKPAMNMTRHPAFEGSPRWSPDGRWLVFSAKRDKSGESQLWRFDFGKNGPNANLEPTLISTKGIEPIRVLWASDSRSLYFQSALKSPKKTYQINVDGSDMQTLVDRGGIPIRVTSEGAILWRVNQTPEIFTKSETVDFPISMTVKRPREDVLTLGFRRIWRTLGERFYDPKMNGRDWHTLRIKYEHAAKTARDSRQFNRVIKQLRGELNASHLAFTPKPWPNEIRKIPDKEMTAHPGMVFDDQNPDPDSPLLITRVIPGSEVSMLPEPPQAGDRILRIAGEEVSNKTSLHRFFNGAENRPLPLRIRSKDGRERVIELRCISYHKARELSRQEREKTALQRVAQVNPKTTYLRVPNMNRDTLENLAMKVYQASLTSEALILDLRDNGGGREADRMLAMFCQPEHSFTISRDGPMGYPVDRQSSPSWNHPMVVLCNQDTFSNAEIFCHAVKHLKRAPLVGTATAGGVISAVKIAIPDVGSLQVPFRGWFNIGTRENLDSRGAQPDHTVEMSPADESAGRDPQLDKALELLKGL